MKTLKLVKELLYTTMYIYSKGTGVDCSYRLGLKAIIFMVDPIAQLVEQQALVLVMGTLSEGCAQGREFESRPGNDKAVK